MASTRPNFLVIVADDLGFSDCGCFGSEIQTPNIDALAAESNGIRFTNYHAAAACSPTRSMLMTGTDHHIAGLGELAEFTRSSVAHQGQPGHEGYLNERVVALPELLKDGGYHTMMAGKWHLGLKPQHHPIARGFARSFALLPGCANHYGYEPQYDDPENEPHKFFETATRALHVGDDKFVEKLPGDFYSSDAYGNKIIEYLSSRTKDERKKPFFAYLPFSAPHWPLQAPKEVADKYKGQYSDGPQALRLKRLQRLKDMGLVDNDVQPHPVVQCPGEPGQWEDMPQDVQEKSARAMEVYAGMVDRMDWNIGRVLDYLKSSGEYDNTFVLFMSDNGAEGASYEALPILGDEVVAHIAKYYNNELDNIGRGDSFVWYGSQWAQAATAPSRLFKQYSTEGGCRVPLVIRPPPNRADTASAVTNAYCTVMDIVPTFLELAGLKHPGTSYKGREIAPVRGKSWQPFLSALASKAPNATDEDFLIHGEEYVTGFEISGSGALRKGHYKLVFVPAPRGPQKWELFNVKEDPGETKDLREADPKRFEDMMKLWEEYKKDVGVIGVAGEYPEAILGRSVPIKDEFDDPYGWIKFMDPSTVPNSRMTGKMDLFSQSQRPQLGSRQRTEQDASDATVSPESLSMHESVSRDNDWLYQSTLPDKPHLKILAESYFNHVHPLRNLGFIHKPSFMKAIDQDTTGAEYGEAVVHLVCALGARYMQVLNTTPSPPANIPDQASSKDASRKPLHVGGTRQAMGTSGQKACPAMVLYSEYGLRIGDNAFVYMLVGSCTRMSRLLRLDAEDPQPEPRPLSPKELTKRESLRRLMWSCYILDSFVGAGVDGNLSWVADEQHTLGTYFFLHLAYHACVFDLTRVTLPGYNFPLAAAFFQVSDEFTVKYRHEAWYHACCASRLLANALECGTGALDDHFTSTAAFESTKIQVIYLTTMANNASRLYSEGVANINTNLRVLTLSALVPFLQRFGFSDIANYWQPFQNTVLLAPSQSAQNNLEVVGPVETAFLNQIATFRLARREITDEEKKAGTRTPWSFSSAPPSPRPDRSGPAQATAVELQASQFDELGLHMLALAGQSQSEAVAGDVLPMMVPSADATEVLPLDQGQYFRLAEEISDYMTWDVALASQFDFPMEDYLSTPGQME
ncbi:Alkaline phosphatase [Fusarium albosuccineum]|uniref:Alkaline phosphatase n=1 Tax=Fusarium albosuccineum TaxID=1237068 RepID=A0A8H4PCH5_9HYPO|nr:Alkaline phosphatase [Fusarium albosuccineum]